MRKSDHIPVEQLKEFLRYEPETGDFFWLKHKYQPKLIGKKAGSSTKAGYWAVAINNRKVLAHRLAWLYMTGKWPSKHIDHIDGQKRNNAFCNLREVDRFGNLQNLKKPTKANKSGFLGVCRHQGKWLMQLMANGKRIRKSGFATAEEAHQAYLEAKRKHHSTCTI